MLSKEPAFKPASANGAADWAKSLDRQLEFYRWLQSVEGGIAGGATNSWEGHYGKPPAGASTFYGMAYDWQPVWHDPPSNRWFGFQCWSMERVAEYYYADRRRQGQGHSRQVGAVGHEGNQAGEGRHLRHSLGPGMERPARSMESGLPRR